MFSDPIFIVALVSVALSIAFWIYKVLSDTLTDQMQQVIYTLGSVSYTHLTLPTNREV